MRIAIVGGSIAGLHAAKYMLDRGLHGIELFEKKSCFGERIICAGGIASYMIRKTGINIPKDFIASKVSRVVFYSPSFDYADLKLEKEYGYVLWRDKWEKWLGDEISADCKVYFKSPNPILKGYDFIVGCDGLTGVTRTLLGLKPPSVNDIHIAIQAVASTRRVPDDAISMFFGTAVAEKGYAWAFPIGGSEFRIGLGVPLSLSRKLISSFNYLVSRLDAKLLDKPMVKMIPTAPPQESLVYGNFILVGDAGLQTDPATGGGIGNAIIGAMCAAEAISKGKIQLYDRLWRARLYRRNKFRYGLKQVLYELDNSDFEKLIDLLKDFKPISESIGAALFHLIIELALKEPKFIIKHKILRRLIKFY